MPIQKNPEGRLKEIIRLLNTKYSGFVRKIELMRRCGIKERSLKSDIAFLRNNYGAKIRYDRKGEGYCLDEPFELPDLPINFHDFARLKMAVGILDQFKHLDIFKDLEATVDKLEQAIKIRTSTKTAPTHIFFEAIPFYQGTELMPFFLNAIDLKRAVRFQYQSFKSPTVRRHDLHPYFLQEFSHRWYIVGWSPLYQAIMPFALDRIVDEPELLSDDFEIPENFNRDEYFKNTYGITRYSETEVAEVVLSFSTIQAKYFKSKPFHPYSIVSEAEDALVVKMQLVVNFELKRKILGFGSEVKVLQPASLCEEIKQLHIASHAQYE